QLRRAGAAECQRSPAVAAACGREHHPGEPRDTRGVAVVPELRDQPGRNACAVRAAEAHVKEAPLDPNHVAAVALGNAAESGLSSRLKVLGQMCDQLYVEAESTATMDLTKLRSIQRCLEVLAHYAPHMQQVALNVGRHRGAAMDFVLHPTTFEVEDTSA